MKCLLYLLFCVIFSLTVKAQYVTIVDPDFKVYLNNKYPSCFNGLGQMDTTCTEITTEDSLDFTAPRDISGIRYFDNLRYLKMSSGLLESIPVLPATLDTFICTNQGVFSNGGATFVPSLLLINNLPDNLKYFDCSNNGLTGLNSLPASLQYLKCSNNTTFLTGGPADVSIPVFATLPASLPPTLTHLICSKTALSSLPSLPGTLQFLDISNNAFEIRHYYDFNGNFNTYSNIGFTGLPSYPLSLEFLNVIGNPFVLPHILPASIIDLTVGDIAPDIQLSPNLAFLECGTANSTCIPWLPASMSGQSPYNNYAYNLILNAGLTSVNTCLPNVVPGVRVGYRISGNVISQFPHPVRYCSVTNNLNNCLTGPSVRGVAFCDLNSNGTQEPGELFRSGVSVSLSNGQNGFTNQNGTFALAGSMNANTLTVTAPSFFTAVPASFNYNFTTTDTVVTEQIALQPLVSKDSIGITITAWVTPRPGFPFSYHIQYINLGTTSISPSIQVTFNQAILTYISSSNPGVTQSGNLLNLTLPAMLPGEAGAFTASFTVLPSTSLGSILIATATVNAGTSSALFETISEVRGSFDPNDKHATASLTELQVDNGAYIDYLIRFQNMGTDTAFNIVVADTLSNLLDETTFQFITASHPCKITRSGSELYFEFSDIRLPYELIDEPASHGYVRFRVKPLASLPDNTNIVNQASIYFDYNVPVQTLPVTTIVNLTTVPVSHLQFSGIWQQGNQVLLSWKTLSEYNVEQYDIEESTDPFSFTKKMSVPSRGNGSNIYSVRRSMNEKVVYYRLRINDKDGNFSYAEIIRIVAPDKERKWSILSQPVSNNLQLILHDLTLTNAVAYLTNAEGRRVKTFILKPGFQFVNVNQLPSGVYFLHTQNLVEKIVIR